MNEKFSRSARDTDDAHVKPGKVKLNDILCMKFDKIISKNYTVRFLARLFQIQKNKLLPRAEDKVIVRIKPDNSVHIIWKDKSLLVKEMPKIFDE
jgi:hypothetical protein